MRLLRRRRKERSKYNRRPAALPRVFLRPIFNYKKGNSRVASAAGVPEHLSNSNYNCFHIINCQIRGSSYSKTPSFGKNTTAKKIASYLHKMPCIREPLRAARAVPPFSFWGETSLRPEGRGTRTAIPIITILDFLFYLHIGSGGTAFFQHNIFPYKKKRNAFSVPSQSIIHMLCPQYYPRAERPARRRLMRSGITTV